MLGTESFSIAQGCVGLSSPAPIGKSAGLTPDFKKKGVQLQL